MKIIFYDEYLSVGENEDGYFVFKAKDFDEYIAVKNAKYVNKQENTVTHIRDGKISMLKPGK